ncbi:unnamed protein product, partial [Ectocarpus fasciculatus]
AVNECLDLNTGRCTFASRYELDLGWCDLTDEDVEAGDLKACFENFGENNIHQLCHKLWVIPALLVRLLGFMSSFRRTRRYMSSNDLTTPPAGMFDSLQAMTLLYLGYNRLETLPAGMFGSLPALTNLNLRTNNLATLPAGIFDSLTGLTELDVTYNQMATLPTGIFSSVPSLTKLDLSFNGLTTLPAGLFDSDNQLTNMDLSYNSLSSLAVGDFDNLIMLTDLDLSFNDLKTLPAGVFDSVPALSKLYVSCSWVSPVEDDHAGRPWTEVFRCDTCSFVAPVGPLSSSQRTRRYLDNNELTTLPAGVLDSLLALTILYRVTLPPLSPPSGFISLARRIRRELRKNDLTTLPAGIFDFLPALIYLDLVSNDLTTLPDGLFESLEALITLDLSDNTDLECLPAVPSIDTNTFFDDTIGTECGCDFGDFANPCSEQELQCTPGPVGYTCAVSAACDPNNDNRDCEADQVCCDDRRVCVDRDDEFLYNPTACGDPHMFGFFGQKFDFTGEDGAWYSLIADDNMHINMRVTSPVPDLPEITYITGLSILATDEHGIHHTMVIEVREPHNLDSSCPHGLSPCLADGSLSVFLDGEEKLLAPGTVFLAQDVQVSAVNLPGACRSFGFEKYWERKRLENARHGRRLSTTVGMGEWILGDPTATNMDECVEYVARAQAEEGGVFTHQSEHASFQIVTPKATVRLSHG